MRIKVNDFSYGLREDKTDQIKGLNCAKTLLNYNVSDGSLVPLDCLKKTELNEQIRDIKPSSVHFYKRYDQLRKIRDDKLIIFDENHVGYYINLYGENRSIIPLGLTLTSSPSSINYRLNGEDVIIIVSKTNHMAVWNGETPPEIILDAPKIGSMDIHYERLFASVSTDDGSELKFSDDLDPTNWSESLSDAGSISFVDERGKLEKIVSFNDYLYLFREHGITRLYANTSLQSSFYVNHLFVAGGRIFGDTVTVAGDRILFLSSDGFYVFDGANTSKVLSRVFNKLKLTGNEQAVFFDGCYYLMCGFDPKDGEATKNNAILRVRVSDMSVSVISGISPLSMCFVASDSGDYVVVANGQENAEKLIKISRNGESVLRESVFSSVWYDFGDINTRKTIKRVTLKQEQKGWVLVEVESNLGERFLCEGDEKVLDSRCLVTGEEFRVSIKTVDPNVKVLSVEVEA